MQNLESELHAHLRPSSWTGHFALGSFMLTLSINREADQRGPERLTNCLAALRREHGWSRQELAHLLHIHPATLAEMEDGRYFPSLRLALRVSELFALPVEAIFFPAMRSLAEHECRTKENIDART